MNEEILVETTNRPVPSMAKRVSWGAIFAGLFVAIVTQVILTLLGAAIGAAAIDPLSERNPGEGLGTGAAIWMLVSGLIALFAGAYVAGRLSGGPRRADGLLHGIVTFSVAEIAMILMLTTAAGALIGGTGQLMNSAVGGTAQGQELRSEWQSQMQQMLNRLQQGGSEPGGSGVQMSPQEEQQARSAGDQVAKGVSQGALWAFIAMALGLAVSAWGGWAGTASLARYRDRGRDTVVATA